MRRSSRALPVNSVLMHDIERTSSEIHRPHTTTEIQPGKSPVGRSVGRSISGIGRPIVLSLRLEMAALPLPPPFTLFCHSLLLLLSPLSFPSRSRISPSLSALPTTLQRYATPQVVHFICCIGMSLSTSLMYLQIGWACINLMLLWVTLWNGT